MKIFRRVELVFWMVIAGAVPAYANNPPQPDGVLSLLLIFPVAIVGYHLSGTYYSEKQRKWRIGRGLLLGLTVLLTLGGTEIALLPLLALLLYGCIRGVAIIRRGQGNRRFLLGSLVIAWTLFAVGDYILSVNNWPRSAMYESGAVSALRTLARAEEQFAADHEEKGKSPSPYASLEELQQSGSIEKDFLTTGTRRTYRFHVEVSSSPSRFFVSATPVEYDSSKKMDWKTFLPGRSWFAVFHPRVGARRSFAVDETGVIRQADLGAARPVTRQEVETWQPLN